MDYGYTEHSHRHISIVSKRAGDILEKLGYPDRTVELARIAGYLHDIGNCVNRVDHAHSGAILSFEILKQMGMPVEERTQIMMAIGNHDENTGTAVSEISAALILADKSDVHRDRVVNKNISTFDIHDRVNYAAYDTKLTVDSNNRDIILNIKLDLDFCSVAEYFEIFVDRMLLCIKSAKYLEANFSLIINDMKMI